MSTPVTKKVPTAIKKIKAARIARKKKAEATTPATSDTEVTSPETSPETSKVEEKTTPKKSKGYGVNFREDSDLAIVWEEVQKGGSSRREVAENCRKRFEGRTTASGKPKPVSTLLNQVVSRALASGYVIKESWQIVPGTASDENPVDADASKSEEVKTQVKKTARKPTARKKITKKKSQ